MAENQDGSQTEPPKYLTHDDLNGALASQKKEFQKLMQTMQQQNQQLVETLQKTLGPKQEVAAPSTRAELSEDTTELKRQIKILTEQFKAREESEKSLKRENTLRSTLSKHGINSRGDLAVKYLQDQVSYDEDGSLVMKMEITPGVTQPLPLAEAIAKFAQTEHGKFLADPKDIRGSGSRNGSAPAQTSLTSQVTGTSGNPGIFKDAKSLKDYVASEFGKETFKM
jgi:hypothetical protein